MDIDMDASENEPITIPIDEIYTIVETIYNDNGSEKQKIIRYGREYGAFAEAYPNIFKMACMPTFDFARFKNMVKLKKEVEEGNISQHDASVKVGTVLFDAYVKDKVNK